MSIAFFGLDNPLNQRHRRRVERLARVKSETFLVYFPWRTMLLVYYATLIPKYISPFAQFLYRLNFMMDF